MELNPCRHGAFVVVGSLLLAVACGTASPPETQSRGQAHTGQRSDDTVVATIGERTVTLGEVDQKLAETNMSVLQELYDARRQALGELVAEALLSEEAAERGMTRDELLAEEVTARVEPVTEADVEAFYEQNRARLGGQSLEQIGGQIREFLAARNEQAARQAFIDGLEADAGVRVALEAPRVPVVVAGDERVRGPESADVTIVEYSDFQWPYCARVGPTLQQVAAEYGDQVRFVYRDFPLPNHPRAAPAAEAALCAHEQGKFWEYHDILFENQRTLDEASLKGFAADVGLDTGEFNQCFDSGEFRDEVQEDYEKGSKLGVNATPAFFINGRFLSGAQPFPAFQRIIEEELDR